LTTVAVSADADPQLTDTDRSQLQAMMESRQPRSYQDHNAVKVAAPIVDAEGRPLGAALMAFPIDSLQAAVGRQIRTAALPIGVVLLVITLIAYLYVVVFTRPVARLDAAVAALGSYKFKGETLNDIAKLPNELGRVARLLQRMATAEQGWRRSLEGLRQVKAELEQRVEERTSDLKNALVHQTELNEHLQEVGQRLQQSVEEMKALAEVSRAINSTGDPEQLLA